MFEDSRESMAYEEDEWAFEEPEQGRVGIVEWFRRMGFWWVW